MSEANTLHYKRPESVLVVIYTLAGDILVLKRCQPPDFWQSVTGSLHWEETQPLATAYRELYEETGLGAAGLDIVASGVINRFSILLPWRQRYAPDVTENIEHVFQVCLPDRYPVSLNPVEHSDYEWLPQVAAAKRVTSYTNRNAILALPLR